jgi:predicted N-formylglutamate amidohydrolase
MQGTIRKIDFGDVVHVRPNSGPTRILIVCEHAANRVPQDLDRMGLPAETLESHIAWDPGALGVAEAMADTLRAPLVSGGVSRLVYDCNRPPESGSAIPTRSEATEIPGNLDLSPDSREERVRNVYHPFHREVADQIQRAGAGLELLLTIHSFTPVFMGERRDVEIGMLHGNDDRFAKAMMDSKPGDFSHLTRLNEPYSAADGVTHTLDKHAAARGMHAVMIEIRSDLIEQPVEQSRMASLLAAWVSAALDTGTK